ncbi:DUF5610 domain-containing protein [Pontibacter sp. JAM-7]|uniref:DUF5610 domain-containing protein n=1 Tax=Pontibacter sp. JAM-7 TaxID=3366581 RepID=UPI003AF6FCC6
MQIPTLPTGFNPVLQQPEQQNTPQSSAATATSLGSLLARLAAHIPGMEGTTFNTLSAADYSPRKVAERIAGFVADGLQQARNRGADQTELKALYQSAQAGFEQGYQEAQDILQGLTHLTEALKNSLQETYNLTQAALDELNPSLQTGSHFNAISSAERFASAQAFSMEIMTRDGDRVTIDFSNNLSQSQILASVNTDSYQVEAAGIEITANSQYHFSVVGNLSSAELASIQALVSEIGLIADDFFNGNLQQAFDQAVNLQMDKSQLMDLNVNMSQSLTYSVTSVYSSIQQMEQPTDHPGRHLGQIKNNLDRFINSPKLDFLQDIRAFSAELLDNLIQQDNRYRLSDTAQQQLLARNAALMELLIAPSNQESANV